MARPLNEVRRALVAEALEANPWIVSAKLAGDIAREDGR